MNADFSRARKGRGAAWLPAALLVVLAALALLVLAGLYLAHRPGGWAPAPESAAAPVAGQPAAPAAPGNTAAPGSAAAPESVPQPVTDEAGAAWLEGMVYLGDSNIKNLIEYGLAPPERVLAEPGIGIDSVLGYPYAAVPGVEGYVTVPEALAIMRPARVLMSYGTNDTELYSAEEFAARYDEAIAAIRAASPDTLILVNAVPPAGIAGAEKGAGIAAFNAALAELCAKEGLGFLNSCEALAGENGLLREEYQAGDNFHLSAAGLAALLEYIAARPVASAA